MHRSAFGAVRAGDTQRRNALAAIVAIATLVLAGCAGTALAGPVTEVNSLSNTTAAPGGTHTYIVTLINVGDEPTPDGDEDFVADDPRLLTVSLPDGVTATSGDGLQWDCSATDFSTSPSTVSCINTMVADPNTNRTSQTLLLETSIDPGVSGVQTATFDVTGGGAPPATTVDRTLFTPTLPPFGIDSFDGQMTANAAGSSLTQAGGHPYSYSTTILFNTLTNSIPRTGLTWPVEATKDVSVDLPPGLVGAPTATGDSLCTLAQLSNSAQTVPQPLCAPGSQVGVAKIFTANGLLITDLLPVFNMVPPPGVPARFGFNIQGTVTVLDASLRNGSDYGLTVNVRNLPEFAIAGTTLTFWGVPADPSHDAQRSCPGQSAPDVGGPSCTTEVTPKAFLRAPTACTANPLTTTLSIDSWANPGVFKTASYTSHAPPGYPFPPGPGVGIDGCVDVPFNPTFTAAPLPSAAAGKPAAFAFDLNVPQSEDPRRVATGDLKKAVITLPAGLRVSPSSANGLGACSAAQINLNADGDAACPSTSKIGTVTVDTPLLSDPLSGSVYLAKPHDNPFDSLLSLYIVARGPGVVVKLPGWVQADPDTGRLSTTFDNNPQLPFSRLHVEFKGGSRAPLVAPPHCGSYATHAVLTSWSGTTVVSDSSFDVSADGKGSPCGAPRFAPKLSAGATSTAAGAHTSFTVRLQRDDEDQELRALSVKPPLGLIAKVAGVPLCPEAKATAGTCDASSLIGSVLTGAGAGENPFYLPGRVYLTGPYKGGPFGLSIVVPAIAGPFDLGTVVVRASIQVDRHTAQLRVVSDTLPRILEGIPLQLRDLRVTIDRAKFMVNPTDCRQKAVVARVTSTGGMTAQASDRFQVGGCAKMRFKPRMRLVVGAKGRTHAGTSTPFTAILRQPARAANLKSVVVSLPSSLNARLEVVNAACTQQEFAAGDCEDARAGTAVAATPLLNAPLRGGVYFVKDGNKPVGSLPNLVVALRGQVDVDLVGKITIPGGRRLATRFGAIPDVPISSFKLTLVSGSRGPLGVAENLCSVSSGRAKALVIMHGQNGTVRRTQQALKVRGCAGKGRR